MPLTTPIRVSIVEDHEPTREMLRALVGGSPGFVCVGTHAQAEDALARLLHERPEVVLADLELPGMDGEALITALKARLPGAEIVVLTIHEEPRRIFRALESGASGYLVKPVAPARLLEAIAEAHAGGSPMSSQIARLVIRTFHERGQAKRQLGQLTSREEELLGLIARGDAIKQVADHLGISVRTVGTHLRRIYQKLQVQSRSAAVARFLSGTGPAQDGPSPEAPAR